MVAAFGVEQKRDHTITSIFAPLGRISSSTNLWQGIPHMIESNAKHCGEISLSIFSFRRIIVPLKQKHMSKEEKKC